MKTPLLQVALSYFFFSESLNIVWKQVKYLIIGSKVAWDCQKEMANHRRMLLEDYRLSPEIVSECSDDISKYCKGLEANGKTIHCLMEHSRPNRRKDRVQPLCQKAVSYTSEALHQFIFNFIFFISCKLSWIQFVRICRAFTSTCPTF